MKICEFESCTKKANYAFFYKTPIFCKKHAELGMKTQISICLCGKAKPTFGFVNDIQASCCVKCKDIDMIDIINKKCICGKSQPSYGYIKDKQKNCCTICKLENMIDLKHHKCKCELQKIPTFGLIIDNKATCCKECKTDDMIDLANKLCKCGKVQPTFGLAEDKKIICCKECRTENMIDLINEKCICGRVQPTFGLSSDKKIICCKECKTDVMVDLKHNLCNCGTRPSFGLPENKKLSHCVICKTDNMIDLAHKLCKANEQEIICAQLGNKKYNGYCTHCFAHLFPLDPLTFQIRCKTKEIATRDFINSIYEGFKHDKPLWIGSCDCTHKRRIDHYYLLGNTLICVETDEFQHKKYNKYDEEIRYDDLMMVHGGKFIFIRFNPDKYKEKGVNKNPTIANRLRELSKEIDKQIKRVDNDENTELVEIIKMYYDN
jgi:hypothetical protein